MLPVLVEINFTPYIPTTAIGLLGLISGYLYFHYKNKNDNKLKEIESVAPEDRKKIIEAYLNDIGVSIDTTKLTSQQKYSLLAQSLHLKSRKFLILSVTTIILAIIIFFLIKNSGDKTDKQVVQSETRYYYKDFDLDGYGDKNNSVMATSQPTGFVTNDLDCCDNDKSVYLTPAEPAKQEAKIWTRGDVNDFLNAAQEGNYTLIKNYVNLGMPVDTQITSVNAALPLAAAYGHGEIVKFLLQKGSNPNQRFTAAPAFMGSTPLIQASYSNFADVVDLLIKYKVDLNAIKADGDAMTALMFAVIQGNAEIVNKLLDAGANANIRRASNGATAKDFANGLSSPKKEEILDILNRYGAKTGGEL